MHPASKVSVIIPMYNAAPFIKEAIESVLAQTFPVSEIWVVDDGSTDNSAEIAAGYPEVSLLKKAHTELSDTLNCGLSKVIGNFIAFLDADDRWLPDKTAIQLELFDNNPELDMVFGYCQRFQMIQDGTLTSEKILDILPGISKVGGLFRSSTFSKTGGFSSDKNEHDFMNWYAKAMEAGLQTTLHQDIVFQRRIHDHNKGVVLKTEQRNAYLYTLKKALDRRRTHQPDQHD